MFEMTIKNLLDILLISTSFCISLKMSVLLRIKKSYVLILMPTIYISLFCIPTITQAGSFMIIYLQVIAVIFINGKRIKSQLLAVTFAYLIMAVTAIISDAIVGSILFLYFDLNELDIINRFIYYISNISLVVFLSTTSNMLILKFYQNKQHKQNKKFEEKEYIIIINMLLLIVLVALILILYQHPQDKKIAAFCTILTCSVVIINQYIYLYFYNHKIITTIKNNELLLYNQNLLKYNKKLERDAQEIIDFKHGSKNMYYSLGELVDESGDEELKKFYSNKIFPISSHVINKESIYKKIKNIKNLPLKSLLYCKSCEALDKNIDVEIYIEGILHESKVEIMELITIMGIFLDNAIEECEGINNSYIKLLITNNNDGEEYIVENLVKDKVNLTRIQGGDSSKGKKRGNGLRIVREIIRQYDFAVNNTEIDKNLFRQIITIYKA